jgi:hypothetical protein
MKSRVRVLSFQTPSDRPGRSLPKEEDQAPSGGPTQIIA